MSGPRLAGKRALVVGTGGIGAAIARRFSEEGAAVACASRSLSTAREAARTVEASGGEAVALSIDLLDRRSIETGFGEAVDRLGGLDVLVQCGGTTATTPFVEIPTEEWREVLGTNLDGTFHCCQFMARHLLERGAPGSIIVVGSQLAQVAIPNKAHYLASKGALTMLTKAMAAELARSRIRVNVLAPGVTRTEMAMSRLDADEAAMEWTLDRIPMGRLGEPEEMSPAAVFLASDESSYVTGSTVVVDGGYLAV